MIRDEGVPSWAVTAAVVVPVGLALSYWYFHRTGDLPGEPLARRRADDEWSREVADAAATYEEREGRKRLVMRGSFRWASPSQESRSLAPGTPRFFATARAERGEPAKGQRIVIDRIIPGCLESEVEARWLLPEFATFNVEPGTVLSLREGRRVVAHLRVHEVE